MRLRHAVLASLLTLLVGAAPAHAGPFVLSGADTTNPATQASSVPGLISLDDGGGEAQNSASGGAVIAGTGSGPVVYDGSGTIRQFSRGAYTTLATNVPGVKSMTLTGRGLVVAIGDRLQYVVNGVRSDVPHGTLTAGDSWVAIATAPNGHLIGWSWNDGWGRLWDLNLGDGTTTSQDYTGTVNDPFFNNRDNGFKYGNGPVGNAGSLAVDGQGGVWVANAEGDGSNSHLYYGAGGSGFNLVTGGPSSYYKPHVTATSDGRAYVTSSDYSASPFLSGVYRFPGGTEVTSAGGRLRNSAIFDLAVDRCYTFCSVAPPSVPGGGGGQGTTGKTASPLSATPSKAKVTKAGLTFTLKCRTACSVSISGALSYAKPKKKKRSKKASASASKRLASKTVKLKAGKATKVTLKLSKGQRKAIKKAKKKRRKITARLKLKITPKGGKATKKSLKLKVS